MKKIIAVALLSIVVASPALAEDAVAAAAKKPASVAPAEHKHEHKLADLKEECATKHFGGDHHEHEMMGGAEAGMMLETDMHVFGALALDKDQLSKINKLSDELKHNNWTTLGLMNDETAKLRDLYQADRRDPAAIGKEYQKVFDLKRQLIETYLDVQNRIEDILSPEQRAKLKEIRHEMHHMHGDPMHGHPMH